MGLLSPQKDIGVQYSWEGHRTADGEHRCAILMEGHRRADGVVRSRMKQSALRDLRARGWVSPGRILSQGRNLRLMSGLLSGSNVHVVPT